MGLREYMARMDSPDPKSALELLTPEVEFLLTRQAGEIHGRGRVDFAAYIASRPARAGHRHVIQRYQRDRDTELVWGYVEEANSPTGCFLGAAVLTEDGLIKAYQTFFQNYFHLMPIPGD